MRARNASDPSATVPGSKPRVPGLRVAAPVAVLGLVLVSAVACAASSTTGLAPAPAPLPGASGAQSSPDPVLAAAKARVEAALGGAVADGAKPVTERIRAALADAGFTADQVEVTAGRTPTGLDAEAVEAAVRLGNDCIVGQLRTGSVAVTVFPVLSDGRCLVGSKV